MPWLAKGRDEGCHQQLADLYGWFTEGFETENLQVVREELQGPDLSRPLCQAL